MSNEAEIIDTRFRSGLRRMQEAGRIREYSAGASIDLEIASIMKKLDGGPALYFSDPQGFDIPVIGNILASRENCEAAFGLDYQGIRGLIGRAMGNPLPPELVEDAPVQEVVIREGIDLGALMPVLRHTEADAGRFVTAGIVVAADPETGIYNASYHRLQLQEPNETGIKLDYGRHLRLAYERAQKAGKPLPIAVCLGPDLALQYTAATMGSQMPDDADELAVAGGLSGRPLKVARAVSQDLLVPAETEIVLEGQVSPNRTRPEGPFGEFIGFLSPEAPAPVFEVTAVTHRRRPIYPAINGYGRETVMLRKYVLEASLLRVLRSAIPIVTDAEMTAGGLHRFHAVVQVRKTWPQHDGLQRNAIMAAFGALKDLDQVIVVDDDINIQDPADVEYALATRFEASRDILVMPESRGHEYVRIGRGGIRAKMGLDATVPFERRAEFMRCEFTDVEVRADAFSETTDSLSALLE